MEAETKKRVRRSAEQRLADLERKREELKAKLDAQLQALDEQKKRLASTPAVKKANQEQQKRFHRALQAISNSWDERHWIAAVARSLELDAEILLAEGEALLEQHGKGRRGRKPKQD